MAEILVNSWDPEAIPKIDISSLDQNHKFHNHTQELENSIKIYFKTLTDLTKTNGFYQTADEKT